jgi:hypothetical protein
VNLQNADAYCGGSPKFLGAARRNDLTRDGTSKKVLVCNFHPSLLHSFGPKSEGSILCLHLLFGFLFSSGIPADASLDGAADAAKFSGVPTQGAVADSFCFHWAVLCYGKGSARWHWNDFDLLRGQYLRSKD